MKVSEMIVNLTKLLECDPFATIEEISRESFKDIMDAFVKKHPGITYQYEINTLTGNMVFVIRYGIARRVMEYPAKTNEGVFLAMVVAALEEMLESLVNYIPPPYSECPECSHLLEKFCNREKDDPVLINPNSLFKCLFCDQPFTIGHGHACDPEKNHGK